MQTFSLTNRTVPLEKGKSVPKGGKISPRGPIGVGSLVGPTPVIDERLCLCVSEAIVEFLGTYPESHVKLYYPVTCQAVVLHVNSCHVIL